MESIDLSPIVQIWFSASLIMRWVALMLLLSKPKKAYPLLLLFFGFFLTIGTAVNACAVIEAVNMDVSIISGSDAGGLVIFPVLGALTYGGFYYLIRSKVAPLKQQLSNFVGIFLVHTFLSAK